MSSLIVLQQMLVLFAMMLIGYFVYKKSWVDDHSASSINKLVVNIFNPVLIVNSVLNKKKPDDLNVMWQNLSFTFIYYILLIVLSFVVVFLLRLEKKEGYKYQMMLIFSNCGFMGIPLIKGIMGDEYVIFVTMYVMGFNILIYTYGLYLAKKSGDNVTPGEGIGKTLKSIFLNSGVIACIIALIIYIAGVSLPDPVITFAGYVGNTTVPLAMMAIGFSLARMPLKEILGDPKGYIFTAIKMFIIPIAAALILKVIPLNIDDGVRKVFMFMIMVPIGSMVPMMAQEYGGDKGTCGKVTVLTTVVALFSIPIVSLFM